MLSTQRRSIGNFVPPARPWVIRRRHAARTAGPPAHPGARRAAQRGASRVAPRPQGRSGVARPHHLMVRREPCQAQPALRDTAACALPVAAVAPSPPTAAAVPRRTAVRVTRSESRDPSQEIRVTRSESHDPSQEIRVTRRFQPQSATPASAQPGPGPAGLLQPPAPARVRRKKARRRGGGVQSAAGDSREGT